MSIPRKLKLSNEQRLAQQAYEIFKSRYKIIQINKRDLILESEAVTRREDEEIDSQLEQANGISGTFASSPVRSLDID